MSPIFSFARRYHLSLWPEGRRGWIPCGESSQSVEPKGSRRFFHCSAIKEPRSPGARCSSARASLARWMSCSRSNLLQKQNIFFYGAFTGTDDADVEDMFDPDFYLGLVNSEYHDSLGRPIKKNHLRAEGGRITVMISSYLSPLLRAQKCSSIATDPRDISPKTAHPCRAAYPTIPGSDFRRCSRDSMRSVRSGGREVRCDRLTSATSVNLS